MSKQPPRVSQIPDAMPASRALRFLMGAAVVMWGLPPVVRASPPNQLRVALVFLGLVAFYTAVHWVVGRYFAWLNPWLGALVAVAPVAVVAFQGAVAGVAAVLFIGVSLLVIAVRGEPGCEVLAIPALIIRRPTHLACLLFTPLDWIERSIGRIWHRD